jgi:N-methylhydantoinase B
MTDVASPTGALLRDLTAEQFQDTYDCDRLTASVISSRFGYVLEHTCASLMTNAFSPILRDYHDFSATLTATEELRYANYGVARSVPLFWGAMRDGVANAVAEFGPEQLGPGDVLIANDPFRMGTHINDVCFIRPFFAGQRLLGFVTIRAHMMDIGGVTPGGMSGIKRSVYENGLVIPPTLLFKGDEIVKSTLSIILDNSRFGAMLMPDFRTIHQALVLGERLMTETVERYGVDAYLASVRYTCDVSAETMRLALETLPDGVHEDEDLLDCDAVDDTVEYRIAVKVTKVGGRCEIDLSGTSHEARTSINAAWPDVKTAAAIALKYLLDPTGAFTSAALRDVDVVLPSGTVISAEPPAAVYLYWEPMLCVISCLFRIFNRMLGEGAIAGDCGGATMHLANGQRADGTLWVDFASASGDKGGWGGTRVADGDSAQMSLVANMLEPSLESVETESPMLIMRKEFLRDSAGPGRHRGGAAVVKDSLWLTPADHYTSSVRQKNATGFGANGGRTGKLGGVWAWPGGDGLDAHRPLPALDDSAYADSVPVAGLLDPATHAPDLDGDYFYWARRAAWDWPANTIYRYVTNGAGGWGEAFERDPELVMRDVRDGYVSVEGAARDYGVVVVGDPETDPEGLRVDADATAAVRNASNQAEG